MRKWIYKAAGAAVRTLYPPRCPCCDEVLLPEERPSGFCAACDRQLPRTEGPVCMKCGKPIDDATEALCHDCAGRRHLFAQGRGLFVYEGCMPDAMYRFKYSNRRSYRHAFAMEAVRRYTGWIRDRQISLIVPVPMYKPKKRKRGYDQAEEFARELSRLAQIAYCPNAVVRVRPTVPQKGLSDQKRKANLAGAFSAGPDAAVELIRGANILVVDDIYTTGTTCDAVAATLLKAGAGRVYCLYICVGRGFS